MYTCPDTTSTDMPEVHGRQQRTRVEPRAADTVHLQR